jgi:hypothetical protein
MYGWAAKYYYKGKLEKVKEKKLFANKSADDFKNWIE